MVNILFTVKRNIVIFLILLSVFLLLAGCLKAEKSEEVKKNVALLPAIEENPSTVVNVEPLSIKKENSPPALYLIRAEQEKKVFDYIYISGEKYPVPKPWRGNSIQQRSPKFEDLKQIPVEYTAHGSRIFVRRETCDAFVKMAVQAKKSDIHLIVHSGFRSSWAQEKIFIRLMEEGRSWEDIVRYVAPPGYSEHMLGVAIDFYPSNWRFSSTPEYQWLQVNGGKFRFIETYPEVNPKGYPWESWHWKYLGETSQDNI